ncbi:uncharacterized protein N7459_004397 [Penicillium hispanicum]|uniref:uncharacterized protein n=1 Tax=Penicillium hispanicum TaxID=1080232 RepID=UPI002542246F|nr:uncharacterized protein N7459_004397 [Penicillium hispanicum]KAJ5584597.1 hypothetical protein N7459_004397 [Penicillium hispanicum]
MPAAPPTAVTLRRSCQTCARGKRRCDRRWPRCSRCLSKDIDCEYVNAPLTVPDIPRQAVKKRAANTGQEIGIPSLRIHTPLRLEIAKEYDQAAIRFLVNGMRDFAASFAQNGKTAFVHPDVYDSGLPVAIRDVQALCKLNVQAEQEKRTGDLLPLLWHRSVKAHRRFIHASSFEELLGCSQAFLLMQCILALHESDQGQYSENTSQIIEGVGRRLWQQAPTQLPPTLSRRHAWLLAESVRRTIIVSLMLRSAYSLKKRKFSVRTPFVDALPFDLRTYLWDDYSEKDWSDSALDSHDSMISLHEYSDAFESGRFHEVTPFGALIFAACKGKKVSTLPFPSPRFYIQS